MKILVLSTAIPFPPLGGGPLRTYHLLRTLASAHKVTLVGFTFPDDGHLELGTAPFPIRTIRVPWEWPPLYRQMQNEDEAIASQAADKLAEETDEPWFASFYESSQMERELQTLTQEDFDLILFEGTDAARFLPIFSDRATKVLDFMDVYSQMAIRAAQRSPPQEQARRKREAERTLRFESRMAHQCRLCLTCSEPEAQAARCLLEVDRLCIIPNGVDTTFFSPAAATIESTPNIVFTGSMNYGPNIEAVRFFASQILPLLQRSWSGIQFHIVGAKPASEVTALASENVIIHGRVPDIRPYFAKAAVVVAPVLSGGGTRLKILEAAAAGKAIVSTSLGAEGLNFLDGLEILIADEPLQFADAVSRLLMDRELGQRLGQQARRVSLKYDWDRIGAKLLRAIGQLVR